MIRHLIYVICSRQCPNGDGIYTLLYALYKYSTSITNQPTKKIRHFDLKYHQLLYIYMSVWYLQ